MVFEALFQSVTKLTSVTSYRHLVTYREVARKSVHFLHPFDVINQESRDKGRRVKKPRDFLSYPETVTSFSVRQNGFSPFSLVTSHLEIARSSASILSHTSKHDITTFAALHIYVCMYSKEKHVLRGTTYRIKITARRQEPREPFSKTSSALRST